jgi:hypothetical protein
VEGAPYLFGKPETEPVWGRLGAMARILGRKDHRKEVADRNASSDRMARSGGLGELTELGGLVWRGGRSLSTDCKRNILVLGATTPLQSTSRRTAGEPGLQQRQPPTRRRGLLGEPVFSGPDDVGDKVARGSRSCGRKCVSVSSTSASLVNIKVVRTKFMLFHSQRGRLDSSETDIRNGGLERVRAAVGWGWH